MIHKILLTFILIAQSVLAYEPPIEALLTQDRRPTIRQIKEALGEFEHHPMGHGYDTSTLNTSLPPVIARFERLCPGAKYFALGRDPLSIADILEAFYDSLGQTDRVGRIPMSSGSFGNVTDASLQSVLQGVGMNFEELGTRPFIIFDRTSLGQGSQSTMILRAAFNGAFSQGKTSAEIAGKLLVASTVKGNNYSGSLRPDFINHQQSLIDQHRYSSMPINIPELAPWTDQSEWHAEYGQLETGPNGFLEGKRGYTKDRASRENVLRLAIQLILHMKSPEILNSVIQLSQEQSFQFDGKYVPAVQMSPEERAQWLQKEAEKRALREQEEKERIQREQEEQKRAHIERQKQTYENLKVNLTQILGTLPPKSEQTHYLSPNGQILEQWLGSVANVERRNPLYFVFIKSLLVARESGKIGDRDLRRLIARAIGRMTIPDETLLAKFTELYATTPTLRVVINEHPGVFMEGQRGDAAQVKQAFTYLETAFSCAGVLSTDSQTPSPPEAQP